MIVIKPNTPKHRARHPTLTRPPTLAKWKDRIVDTIIELDLYGAMHEYAESGKEPRFRTLVQTLVFELLRPSIRRHQGSTE